LQTLYRSRCRWQIALPQRLPQVDLNPACHRSHWKIVPQVVERIFQIAADLVHRQKDEAHQGRTQRRISTHILHQRRRQQKAVQLHEEHYGAGRPTPGASPGTPQRRQRSTSEAAPETDRPMATCGQALSAATQSRLVLGGPSIATHRKKPVLALIVDQHLAVLDVINPSRDSERTFGNAACNRGMRL